MKAFYALFVLSLFYLTAFSQQPSIQWQKSFGGTGFDFGYPLKPTADGGYIFVGTTSSTDGDVTGNHGNTDIWIVKLSNTGAIEWQKSFGGTAAENGYAINQTADGGYIVVGSTFSTDGDVSGNHGNADVWVFNISNAGVLLWQRCLGGTAADEGYSFVQTGDGGYVLTGYTSSTDGDVTGNHGNRDAWLVKLSNAGVTEWQKCLGGSNAEEGAYIQNTTDGGFIISGYTESNNGDVRGHHGEEDVWLVKTNGSGTIQWQKCFGGSADEWGYSPYQTPDGGFILTGWTESNDGDVSGNHGASDAWVIKTGVSGSLEWQKCFGGSSYDVGFSLQLTTNGGYIFAGWTESNDGDVSGFHGVGDTWVVKITDAGGMEWQKCFGGSDDEQATDIHQTADGGYILIGSSFSNDGDITNNHGNEDIWVVKLNSSQLPVTLNNLSAQVYNAGVICKWQTLSEINSSHFVIQRSKDGLHFEDIGSVKASETSTTARSYQFEDTKASLQETGKLFYRLKMVDKDGTFTLSNIVSVGLEIPLTISLRRDPGANTLSVNTASNKNTRADIVITNMEGRLVYKNTITIPKGKSEFPVPLANLTRGLYVISVSTNANHLTQKFIRE